MAWSSLVSASRTLASSMRTGTLRHIVQYPRNAKRLISDGMGEKNSIAEAMRRFSSSEYSNEVKKKMSQYGKEAAVGTGAFSVMLYGAWRMLKKEASSDQASPSAQTMTTASLMVPAIPGLGSLQPVSFTPNTHVHVDDSQPCVPCAEPVGTPAPADATNSAPNVSYPGVDATILTASPYMPVVHDGGNVKDDQNLFIPEMVSETKETEVSMQEPEVGDLADRSLSARRRRRKTKSPKQESAEE